MCGGVPTRNDLHAFKYYKKMETSLIAFREPLNANAASLLIEFLFWRFYDVEWWKWFFAKILAASKKSVFRLCRLFLFNYGFVLDKIKDSTNR